MGTTAAAAAGRRRPASPGKQPTEEAPGRERRQREPTVLARTVPFAKAGIVTSTAPKPIPIVNA